MEGKYNSLAHDDDEDIVSLYYNYNPDITDNADIFFEDIITGQVNWKEFLQCDTQEGSKSCFWI